MLRSLGSQCQTKTGNPRGGDPGCVSAFCIFLRPSSEGRFCCRCGRPTKPSRRSHTASSRALLQAGKVREVVVTDDALRGELTEAIDGKTRFVTNRVDPDLAQTLQAHGVEYSKQQQSVLVRGIVSWSLPLLLFLGFWFFLNRRMAGLGGPGAGLMSVGKSRAKVYMETDTRVTFADVAGVDEAKQELQEVVAFLKDPESYGRLGARMPRGILLVGAPGTGKTLLARAVAGESGVPFFSISGSEFVEMFVGVGAARVRDLFDQARQQAPCIIFIDELDALGRARNAQPFSAEARTRRSKHSISC